MVDTAENGTSKKEVAVSITEIVTKARYANDVHTADGPEVLRAIMVMNSIINLLLESPLTEPGARGQKHILVARSPKRDFVLPSQDGHRDQ